MFPPTLPCLFGFHFVLQVLAIAALFAFICRRSADLAKNWKEQNDDVIITSPTPTQGRRSNVTLPGHVTGKKLQSKELLSIVLFEVSWKTKIATSHFSSYSSESRRHRLC